MSEAKVKDSKPICEAGDKVRVFAMMTQPPLGFKSATMFDTGDATDYFEGIVTSAPRAFEHDVWGLQVKITTPIASTTKKDPKCDADDQMIAAFRRRGDIACFRLRGRLFIEVLKSARPETEKKGESDWFDKHRKKFDRRSGLCEGCSKAWFRFTMACRQCCTCEMTKPGGDYLCDNCIQKNKDKLKECDKCHRLSLCGGRWCRECAPDELDRFRRVGGNYGNFIRGEF